MSGSWTVEVPHDRVVVTGGGSGIGRATALELAKGGTDVYVLGRRVAWLEETARLADGFPGRIVPVPCDIRDPDRVEAAFATVERDGIATGLVNAAAQVSMLLAKDISPTEFGNVIDATVVSAFSVLRRWALPLLDAEARGAAVLVTSSNASLGAPGLVHSSAGKAGTNAMAKTLGREWGPYGITVNAVGPGPFPVEKSVDMWADPRTQTRMFREVALGRYGELEEIVGPIMYFLSRGGAYTTGQVLAVDGGMSLQHWPLPPEEMDNGQTVWKPNFKDDEAATTR